MRRVTRYVRSRLHRRLFVWFGASIFVTALAVGLVVHLLGAADGGWRAAMSRAETFLGGRFAQVWDEPAQRDELGLALSRDLGTSVVIEDPRGRVLGAWGETCKRPDLVAAVRRGEELRGTVSLCAPRAPRRGWVFFLVLGVAAATLWGATGMVARRLTRPLGEVARVADAIGSGQLSTRVTLRRNRVGEIAVLADAINEMADRIERQMADQRELLAGVSHEIRSPLARLRVLAEMARDGGADAKVVDEIEQEVIEIDSLVGELLASSRLDFEAVERRTIDAREIALRALERAGLDPALLEVETDRTRVSADPTLVARALANLLDNARKHGGGATRLSVRRDGESLSFAVDDSGTGIAPDDLPRVFEKFVRGERSAGSSLGLGLSLVRRIAEAHGGRAFAENRSDGGARVGFSLLAPTQSHSA
jgi:two-component system OmpR family sensor kinase